jgi:hypothetical protein
MDWHAEKVERALLSVDRAILARQCRRALSLFRLDAAPMLLFVLLNTAGCVRYRATSSAPGNTAPPAETATSPGTSPGGAQPVTFPCQSDLQCGAHRCNLQLEVCAWPCSKDNDCLTGYRCEAPACVPPHPAGAASGAN